MVFDLAKSLRKSHGQGGAVLLEVVLALGLFVAAAAIIGASLNASITALERGRLQTHAVNLTVSIMSEIQMGIRQPISSTPEAMEPPYDDWIWQIQTVEPATTFVEAARESGVTTLQVIVHHTMEDVVHRLTQTLPLQPGSSTVTNETELEFDGSLLP